MARTLNAATIADQWANGMANCGDKIRAGVNAVNESPTEKAAQASDRYVSGVQRAASNGKFQAGLRKVTLEDWRKATLDKGINRIPQGAAQAKPKFKSFMAEFIPHLEQGMRELDNMPRGDVEQNIARAAAMMRHNAKFARTNR